MVQCSTWVLLSILVAASAEPPLDLAKTPAGKQAEAEVLFADGSVVRVVLLHDFVDVMTKYGKLTIPTRDIRKVALWLGHADIRTTEIYLRTDPSEKLEAMEAVLPVALRRGRFKAPDTLIASLFEQ